MAEHVIEIPPLRVADGPSVALQAAEVAGSPLWAVTIRNRENGRLDRWFADEFAALAHAVEHADRHGLLLVDLRESGAE